MMNRQLLAVLAEFTTRQLVAELDRRDANPLTEFRRAGGRTKGAAKARTSEQARAAVLARWQKAQEAAEKLATRLTAQKGKGKRPARQKKDVAT